MTQPCKPASVALITGAAKRIGAQIARTLHHQGYDIALHYHTSAIEAHQLADELNHLRSNSTQAFCLDLKEIQQFPQFIEQVMMRFGQIDLLVNNASSYYPTSIHDVTQAHWDQLMLPNLQAPLFLSKEAYPFLRRQKGSVVNITDIHTERPLPGYLLYHIAKAGVVGLTKALAVEFAPDVRVNAVAPGCILWPSHEFFTKDQQLQQVERSCLKKEGRPEDIAQAVLFLAQATYVDGQILAVDGGRSICS